MATIEKEKAIDVVKQMVADGQVSQEVAEKYFPELKESKESEEERIRKDIISYLKSSTAISPKTWIAWLEKQKVLTTEEDLQGKEDVLWCIKQAKKYAKDENEMGTCWFAEKWLEKQGEQKPTIEMKSAEESLGIDSDTYNKIVDECIYGEQKPTKGAKGNDREIPFSEQEPVLIIPKFRVGDEIKTTNEESLTITKIDKKGYWSEDLFICGFGGECLWDLVEQKPAWSEEDKEMLNLIIDIFEVNHPNGYFKANELNDPNMRAVYTEEIVAWLKSLKERYTWKPSKKEKEALLWCVVHLGGADKQTLGELLEALNKL